VNRQALDELKQQIPLMGYLQALDWSPARPLSGGRWMGLCPLHEDHKPSFLVDTNKDLFYCYGCGRGGDVILNIAATSVSSSSLSPIAPPVQLLGPSSLMMSRMRLQACARTAARSLGSYL
jgi:CHC2 zinc finger